MHQWQSHLNDLRCCMFTRTEQNDALTLSNSLRGGGLDIFWNHTMRDHPPLEEFSKCPASYTPLNLESITLKWQRLTMPLLRFLSIKQKAWGGFSLCKKKKHYSALILTNFCNSPVMGMTITILETSLVIVLTIAWSRLLPNGRPVTRGTYNFP